MKYIIVDLEMNEIQKKYSEQRKQCRFEIMEIGAIMLDENFKEIDSFKTFVKPEFNYEIKEPYTNLTGITTEMVVDAPVFSQALRSFSDWCYKKDKNITVYAWSNCDLTQIKKEAEIKQYEYNANEEKMIKNWKDFQKVYTEKIGFDHAISLEKALTYAGLDFKGKQHDALFDARNTAELVAIVNDEKRFKKMLGSVVDALKETDISNSLGDLFDMSQFIIE